tara:strand:+ start:81 stop:371 length:291 start_codon:yes stop_codon:yes gene_type:complete
MLTIRKTNLSEHNRGICGSKNNTYYTGQSVCWAIDHSDMEGIMAVKRKKDAELIVKTINENEPEWDAPNSICPIGKANQFLTGKDQWLLLLDVKTV